MTLKEFTPQQITEYQKFYEENGYVLIPNFVSVDEIDKLKTRAEELVDDFFNKPESKSCISIFSTQDQTQKSDQYFINSGDKIRFFFEEKAFDKEGNFQTPKNQSINKIGHALGELDDVFKKFTFHPTACSLVKSLGMKDPLLVQSMYIFKQPKIGGFVSIHQDNTFMNTKPMSCMAFWYAVDDVTLDNGCLWVVPKSHKDGICSRFKRNKEGTSVLFSPPDPEEAAPWASLKEKYDKDLHSDLWVPLPCEKGSLIVIHGSVVHMSAQNTSPISRHAYTFHMIEANSLFSSDNWLQRSKEMPFVRM